MDDNEFGGELRKEKKKRKKKPTLETAFNDCSPIQHSEKKKRKKKRTLETTFNDCSPIQHSEIKTENHYIDTEIDYVDEDNKIAPKVKKKKKRAHESYSTDVETGTENGYQYNHVKKKKSKKSVVTLDESVCDIPDYESIIKQEVEDMPSPIANGILEKNPINSSDAIPVEDVWPMEDLEELLNKIMATLPENDTLKYSSRVAKIDWEKIAFGKYSSHDSSKMWNFIQHRLRRFRLLSELVTDAKNLINSKNFIKVKLAKHPEEPTKPLSSFMLYYMKRKDSVIKLNPGIAAKTVAKLVAEMYQNLSTKKKERYMNKAKMLRAKYEEDLENFYAKYPDQRPSQTINKKRKKNDLFEKPLSAFKRYVKSITEALAVENGDNFDKEKLTLEKYRENWKKMDDKKKLVWIKETQKEESEYLERLKAHSEQDPDFVMPPFKTVITKDELKLLKGEFGLPKKPPNSAYSLYSQIMLQDNANLKDVAPRDRLTVISKKWKELSDEEKTSYANKLKDIQEQHKLEYASYFETLTEDQKTEEINKSKPKKKKIAENKINRQWPSRPPLDVYGLFKQKFKSRNKDKNYSKKEEEEIAQKQFKELSEEELQIYKDELDKLQTEYMAHIDQILKSKRETGNTKEK